MYKTYLKKINVVFTAVLISLCCLAQPAPSQRENDLPKDYLPKEFHAGRREALRQSMPDKSVVAVFAYPVRTFSNDVDYFYHQNPDMYYFSGYKEPHSLLLIFKEDQTDSSGKKYNEILFVQERNALAEQWTGRRLGAEGAKEKLGFRMAFNGDNFLKLAVEFSKFDKIIFDELPEDVAVNRRDKASLFELLKQFKEKAAIPADYSKDKRFDNTTYHQLTASLREIKTPEEMSLLRKAIEISCQGQNEVMKVVRPDMSEMEIQGLHEYVHKKYGAEGVGYGSIIGAGENGCVLHYMENTKTKVGNTMLLMDVGADAHHLGRNRGVADRVQASAAVAG